MDTGVFAGLTLVSGPASEPVTLSLARTWLKRGDSSEDTTIGALITAARQQVEADAGLRLTPQTVDFAVNAFPVCDRFLRLPVGPLQSITSVTLYDRNDAETAWSSSNYYADKFSRPPRLCLNASACWPRCLRPHVAAVIRLLVGFVGAAATVTSIVRSGSIATIATSAPHGLSTGAVATIAGADQAEYNGVFDVTVTSATQFTVQVSGSPATPATGTIAVTPSAVPEWALLAIKMRLAQFSENRDGFSSAEQRLYDTLLQANGTVWLA